jgi:hypothetical protein
MAKLGTAITETIISDYGRSAFLSRLSDPFWFQALGAVMGMDWHSSGVTTSVMGALKRGLAPRSNEFGVYICGGRGRFSSDHESCGCSSWTSALSALLICEICVICRRRDLSHYTVSASLTRFRRQTLYFVKPSANCCVFTR